MGKDSRAARGEPCALWVKGRGRLSRRSALDLRSGQALDLVAAVGPCLRAAIVQHVRILNRLSQPDFAYSAMRPIAMTVAALLMLIGVFGLIAISW
jgi:hypothetical protein